MPGLPPPRHAITSSASLRRLYWLIIAHPRFGLRCLRLLITILRTYILPQYTAHRRHRVALDMELDAAVPFDETWLASYLGFVRLWQGSLGWLHLRFGDRALPEMEGFIEGLGILFREAWKVFTVRDSTVANRPGPRFRADSLLIHAFDRNAYCFPSLHVMIVRYNHLRLAAAVARLGGGADAYAAEMAFLEERALRIVESIVHVKQHSLSDIPAALFLLNALGGLEGIPEADRESNLRFLDRLFLQGEHDRHGRRIREFMRALYERLHSARASGRGPHEALAGFLERYEEEVAELLRTGAAEMPAADAGPGSGADPRRD
ncbi:MAG: hypothetical protein JF616_01820 [Fibrobacteres bacterium]|jgi:hypothetical protein|nr:hypothetical protein [Fibrobacterota bacterium]